MDFSSSIISLLLHFLLLSSLVCPINSSETETGNHQLVNQTIRSEHELHKLKKLITTRLQEINKPAKTIQSSDGDIIDCVLTHKQPAFDHPLLKGQKPLDPPERSIGHNQINNLSDIFQLWSLSGESCPEGTIPIRRITEKDLLRVDSVSRFGRKDADNSKQEQAYVSVGGDGYTGAKATINLWRPRTESRYEYSTGQIWIFSETGEAIEAGWHVFYDLYGDNRPRLFIYWTADNYEGTGCYNLKCSGFVQTNRKVVIGGSLSPTSLYNGVQYEFPLKIWKDEKNGHWWLEYGKGDIIGYWPSSLFKRLQGEGDFAQFGGQVLNLKTTGFHTSTQMGSGHFDSGRFKKAAYIRNMQVAVNTENIWIDLPDPEYGANKPGCYDVRGRYSKNWGNFILYGGPGRNANCR